MIGQRDGFVCRLIKARISVPTFYYTIQQQALFAKVLVLNDAMRIAVKIIKCLNGGYSALNHRKLVAFLEEVNADYKDVFIFEDVRMAKSW